MSSLLNGTKFYEKEEENMPSKHKLSPSSSERFLQCTASLPHNLGFTENEHTLIGNLQHKVAFLRLDQLFNNKDHKKEIERLTDTKNKFESRQTPNLYVYWNDSCTQTVNNYVTYVKQVYEQYKPKMVFLEYRISMNFYGNKVNGVVDCAMVLDTNELFIIDLKTGRNKVETEDNTQMLMYGYGIIQELHKKTKKVANSVVISIAQSLINNTQAYKYTLEQMIDWYLKQAQPMKEINTDKLVYRPSKVACKYCQFRESCNERIKAGVV